jgi:hypothetical protein
MRTPVARPAPFVPARSKSITISASWIAGVVGAIAGFAAVRFLPGVTVRVMGGIVAGALVGLIPFFVARRRGDLVFAQWAMAWSVVAGAIFGILLAAPVAFGLTILAATRRPR